MPPSSVRCGVAIASLLIFLLGGGGGHAGCPYDYAKLDSRAQQAMDAFNSAEAWSRCARARELVKAEQTLFRFVEECQVQCVLDPEIIDVQQRRMKKARQVQEQSCGQK